MYSLFYRACRFIFQCFFYLLYHQFAWSYDWVARLVSLGRWNDWVLSTLPYINGQRVLELGCGLGHLQVALRSSRLDVVLGLDLSKQMLRMCFKRLVCEGFVPMLVNGYAQYIPFQSGIFNQVVATFPTPYILDPQTLQEIFRLLSAGGQLIVLPFAWITGETWLDRFAAFLFFATGQSPEYTSQTPPIDAMFSRFTTPIINAGFEVEVHFVELESSRVAIVLATKPEYDQKV